LNYRIANILLIIILISSSCKKETVRKVGYDIHGIDVSHHQEKISWDSLCKKDLNFVFIKATEGKTHTDDEFDYNWEEAKRIGLKRGAYHFFSIYSSALEQAEHFINTVSLEDGDFPPVLDVENVEGLEDSVITKGVDLWLKAIENHYKTKPIIYTNVKLYNKYVKGRFDEYPLWLARYENDDEPALDKDGLCIWQYGNRGKMPGIGGHVDFNVFLGSKEKFDELCCPSSVIKSKPLTPN